MTGEEQQPADDMRGKSVLITGANSGIGFEAAKQLARRGAAIVMVCRDAARGLAARKEIARLAIGAAPALLLADLSSEASIRALVSEIRQIYPQIDVLINNAGGVFAKRELSVDGIEKTFATNCLAPFLLTHLLLDRLGAAPAGRIVNIASALHKADASFIDDLQCQKRYRFLLAYKFSKLGVILMIYEMARRLKDSRVTVNCVEPGPTRTRFGDNMRGLSALFPALMKRMPFFKTAAESARAIVFLASSPALARTTGQYFVKSKPTRSAPITHDRTVAARHWEKLTELRDAQPTGAAESRQSQPTTMRAR